MRSDTERNVQAWMKRESEREPEPASPARQKTPDSQRELDESRQGAANSQERLFRLQAEREADRALHQFHIRQAQEPQRKAVEKAQLEKDLKTFNDAAKTLRSFSVNQANFNLIRQTLGSGFSVYAIQQAANTLQLSAPKQKELDRWTTEDIEKHNNSLLNADPDELRKQVREESIARHRADQQRLQERQLEAAQQRDSHFGFPALPETWNGQQLDAAFIRQCDVQTHKLLTKRFGPAQLTARLQGRS